MTLGPMSVDRWMKEGHYGKRVLLDGVDITDTCRWFNDETGEAECYVRDGDSFVVTGGSGDVLVNRLTGRIEVVTA